MMSPASTTPLIGSLSVEYFKLSNGLQVAVVNDPTTPIFSYQTWFKVGSADERPGRQGLAHLFEHMMFRKTSNRDMGVWEREVNSNGGTGINAYTSRDQTVYYFTFPRDKVGLAAELESDRMSNLVIDFDMFETEKGAVLTERNRGLDNPARYLWEELYKLRYTVHNYRYSIIGEEESIKSFTVKEAEEFYQTYYSPNNALIIAVGDLDSNSVIENIEKKYSSLPSRPQPIRPCLEEPTLAQEKSLILSHPKATQKMMAKAWLTGNILNEDYPSLWIIGKLLSGQKTALLQKRLVNTAKARSVHADIYAGKENGTFEFYAEVPDHENFSVIDSVVTESIEDIANGKISEEQLQVVKNGIEKEYYANIVTPSMLARVLGEGFIFADDLHFQISIIERLKEVSTADIQKTVSKYLIEGKPASVYLNPTTS